VGPRAMLEAASRRWNSCATLMPQPGDVSQWSVSARTELATASVDVLSTATTASWCGSSEDEDNLVG
jgi:hypothetical protein